MIVIDASAAIEIARQTQRSARFQEMVLGEDKVIAPSLFVSETANAVWKVATHGYIAEEDCLHLFKAVLNEVDEFVPDEELFPEALTEAVARKHPVYDMLYFILARRTSAPLLTCDRRLATLCRDGGVECVEIVEGD